MNIRFLTFISVAVMFAFFLLAPLQSQTRYMEEAYFESAMDQYQMGNYEAAVKSFEKFLELAPNDFNGHFFMARSYGFLGNTENAIKSYERSLEINDPKHVCAQRNMGIAIRGKGSNAEAMKWFKKALDIDPDNSETHIEMGKTLRELGDFDAAISHFRHALKSKPGNSRVYVFLGEIYEAKGDTVSARKNYKKAIELDPACEPALSWLKTNSGY